MRVEFVGYYYGMTGAKIFDDFGRPAFRWSGIEGVSETAYVDGVEFGYDNNHPYTRHPFSAPHRTFPYRPLDLTEADIDDFSYDAVDTTFERLVSFSDEGLLEHLSLSFDDEYGTKTVEIDNLHCGGVVLETVDFNAWGLRDEVIVYYYGCDDFVLPALPNF